MCVVAIAIINMFRPTLSAHAHHKNNMYSSVVPSPTWKVSQLDPTVTKTAVNEERACDRHLRGTCYTCTHAHMCARCKLTHKAARNTAADGGQQIYRFMITIAVAPRTVCSASERRSSINCVKSMWLVPLSLPPPQHLIPLTLQCALPSHSQPQLPSLPHPIHAPPSHLPTDLKK